MKKDNYYQQVRGICIILVILIHTLYITDNTNINNINIIIRRIINFATATFVFMSGLFLSISNKRDFYKKKAIRLVIPLIIWDIIYGITSLASQEISAKKIISTFLLSSGGGHLYYLYVLIQLFIICPFLIKYIQKGHNKVLLYMPLMISPLFSTANILCQTVFSVNIPLYNYWALGWISFFYLGLLFKYKSEKTKKISNRVLILILLILSIIEGLLIYLKFNNYNLAVSQLTFSNSLYSLMICHYIYSNASKTKVVNALSIIGDYSFGIYLSHIIVLKIITKIISVIGISYFLSVAIEFVLCLSITFLINLLYYRKVKPIWKKS